MQEDTNIPEPTKHRFTDENGNPDDKLTEQEALDQAASEGIYFKDDYVITKLDTLSSLDDGYESYEDAQKALDKMENKEAYTISQRRTQSQ